MAESVERNEMSLVVQDETSVVYEAPALSEVGSFAEVTQGPATLQAEGSSGFMV